jgi:hypothetical protein
MRGLRLKVMMDDHKSFTATLPNRPSEVHASPPDRLRAAFALLPPAGESILVFHGTAILP